MPPCSVRALVLIVLLPMAGRAAAQTPVFLAADVGDSAILAPTIDSVDWERLARIGLAPMDLAHPDTALLRRTYSEIGNASYLPFRSPVPQGYPKATYLLVTDSGVAPVGLAELRGEVGYDVDTAGYRPTGRRVVFGSAAFHRPAGIRGMAEFVVWSSGELRGRAEPATVRVEDPGSLSVSAGMTRFTLAFGAETDTSVAARPPDSFRGPPHHAMLLWIVGRPAPVLVLFWQHGGFCENGAVAVELGPVPARIGVVASECDV
jgi:hypothetical protein